MGAKGRAKGFMKEDPSLARAMGVDGGGGAANDGGGRWKGGGGRGRGRGDGQGGARRARPMTAISLDKFARAKTSTYDKRAVLEKRFVFQNGLQPRKRGARALARARRRRQRRRFCRRRFGVIGTFVVVRRDVAARRRRRDARQEERDVPPRAPARLGTQGNARSIAFRHI